MIDTNHLSTLELLPLSVTAFLPINQTLFLPALRCNQTTISKHLLLCYCFKRILTGNMFRERPWGLHLKHRDYTFAWILLTTPGKISEGTRNKSYLWTLWSSPRRENYNRKFLKKILRRFNNRIWFIEISSHQKQVLPPPLTQLAYLAVLSGKLLNS